MGEHESKHDACQCRDSEGCTGDIDTQHIDGMDDVQCDGDQARQADIEQVDEQLSFCRYSRIHDRYVFTCFRRTCQKSDAILCYLMTGCIDEVHGVS